MSRALTEQERGDLAAGIVPTAAHVVCLVHGDGGPEDIQAVLGALDEAQRAALVVILAGMVDPGRSVRDALGWADAAPGDRAPAGALDGDLTIRETGEVHALAAVADGEDYVDEVAVRAYLSGRRVHVTYAERLEAIRQGVTSHGMSYLDFDAMHGMAGGTTGSWVSQARKRANVEGRPFPAMRAPGETKSFTNAEVVQIRDLAAAGVPDEEVASRFQSSPRVIRRIVTGDTHKAAGGPIREVRRRSGARVGEPPRETRWNTARGPGPGEAEFAVAS